MNTYIFIMLLVFLATAGFWTWFIKTVEGANPIPMIGTFVGSIASVILLLASFTTSYTVKTTDTKDFLVETTPYRVIVTAFNKEATYTDAYMVKNASKISAARLTTPYNPWGISLDADSKISAIIEK